MAIGKPNTITISWTQIPGALYYNVFRSSTSGGPYQLIGRTNPVPSGNTSAATNSYTDGPNTLSYADYYYVVSTVTVDGESAYSAEIAVPAPVQATAPSGLTAVVT